MAGSRTKRDSAGSEGFEVAVEIVRIQEQEDSPARLVADEGRLLRGGGAGEEEGGGVVARARRRDEHPALVLLGLNGRS